ncbi:hypothetical protein OJ996_14885 [Luteolibacter sp. GHJ8]|uniref:DUF1634 domain-containing protein n=1 Tax=Luteolibacter rhizosphaerae TaxID=2989719 RepID=A0ABT3G4T5_9BACT|nr:hypothetical protein [Luteolibacter rhizosphaerae]MCW1914871.1 hypothetical protein [Luteolibacter rhizosphaerae]
MDKISASDSRSVACIGLVMGVLVIAGGIFGIWLQGEFYPPALEEFTQATEKEIRMAFFLPGAVTLAGGLLVAPVILSSPLTRGWTASRRALVYALFAGSVILLCYLAAVSAAARAA